MLKTIITAILLILFTCAVQAEDKQKYSEADLAAYNKDLARIEQYLNSITTFASAFSQVSSDGQKDSGMFYLSRPGRLRWQYDAPNNSIIIAKGSLLTYYDGELKQVSHVALDDNLSSFLIKDHISLTSGVNVIEFRKDNGAISITFTQENKESEGQLTLKFSDNGGNLELASMEVLDAVGKKTIIELDGGAYGVPLDDSLFVLKKDKK